MTEHRCDLCWTVFDTEEELAQHVEIEEALDYRIDGEGYEDRSPSGSSPGPAPPAV